ncbi:23S rRNA (adenine(2030)-N(6))-methyltransferase RlmJ [Ascidiaceihabitans sp.]|uniref:23S rRNA (adenine(2030)-N(6))-methyltransferase RlmJ n=1 Tax=Ascidiaceihabitans sp. TaxID=1872644 RepID=UPI003296EB92
MLSYQHIYHAGNLADVHKHSLMAWMLRYLTAKDKPLSYIETHAGRALYDLTDAEALKTAEAAAGIQRLRQAFVDHPYGDALSQIAETYGENAYPGSPLIASSLLRPTDSIHLCELHPTEHAALELNMSPYPATCHKADGFAMAHSLLPPTPRRGVMLIDPSYEIKADYVSIPKDLRKYARAWNVGIIAIWYPVLANNAQEGMVNLLRQTYPDALCHEVRFAPAKPGHGMIGSGMFVLNPPYGAAEEAKRISKIFSKI